MNLVTGATGHIGNVLVRELLHRGEPVRVFLLEGEDLGSIKDLDVEVAYGNVLDKDSLARAFVGVDVVFHLAGLISISAGQEDLIHKVNVEGTRNVIEAATTAGVKRFIYTSSIHAFKRIPYGNVVDETVPIDPQANIAAYDKSKAEATLLILEKVKEGLPAVIACPTGVIGPYDYQKSELGELFNEWMLKKVNFGVTGSYDFVDVRDVAEGLILARDKGKIGQLYILSGHLIRVADLWKLTKELLSFKSTYINIPRHLANVAAFFAQIFYNLTKTKAKFTKYSIETLNSNADISNLKARHDLGYSTRFLKVTLLDTFEWWRKNRSFLEKKSKKRGAA